MAVRPADRDRPPLDAAALEALALRYVGRYATTRAKLTAYLERKLRERGYDGSPPVEAIVARMVALGYVDDRAFAAAKARSLARRGFGARRVALALRAAGVAADELAELRDTVDAEAWNSALAFARRKRIGPFAATPPDADARRKAYAALLRAGHATEVVRRLLKPNPGDAHAADELADGAE